LLLVDLTGLEYDYNVPFFFLITPGKIFFLIFLLRKQNLKMVIKIEIHVLLALLNPFADPKSQGYTV
jgi:cell division protein FtsW (lipid II flippase)